MLREKNVDTACHLLTQNVTFINNYIIDMTNEQLKEWAEKLYDNDNCSKEWRDRFISQLKK